MAATKQLVEELQIRLAQTERRQRSELDELIARLFTLVGRLERERGIRPPRPQLTLVEKKHRPKRPLAEPPKGA